MAKKISTIDQIIGKIVYRFGLKPDSDISISWKIFVGIMSSGEDPVYESVRTIREKWQILHAVGYLTATNQYVSKLNVPRIFDEVMPRITGEGQ